MKYDLCCQDTPAGVGQLSCLFLPFLRCRICLVFDVLVLYDSIVSLSSVFNIVHLEVRIYRYVF
jgi:hypothetical protein